MTTTKRSASSRGRRRAIATGLIALAPFGVAVSMANASEPPKQTAVLSRTPGVSERTWTGTIPAGASGVTAYGTDKCVGDEALEDIHEIEIKHDGSGLFRRVNIDLTFSIRWAEAVNDNALTVFGPDGGVLDHQDGGEPFEAIKLKNLDEGTYRVVACPFAAATPSPYEGKLTIVTSARPQPPAKTTTTTTSSRAVGSTGSTARPSSPSSGRVDSAVARPSSSGGSESASPVGALPEGEVSESAPQAFRGAALENIVQTAPAPVPTRAATTERLPLWLPIGVTVLSIVGTVMAIIARRRRQLDTPVTSGIVPVGS